MIERLYIHNFRCFEHFEMKIGDKQNLLLIGNNGSGKTTIRLVLQIFQSIARGVNRVKDLVKPTDMTRNEVPLRIELEARIQNIHFLYTLALDLPDGFKELRVMEEKLVANSNLVFERIPATVEIAKEPIKTTQFGIDWHLVALPVIQAPEQSPLKVFLNWLGRMLLLSPEPARIKGEQEERTLWVDSSVENIADWWAGLLNPAPSLYTTIDSYLKGIMPEFKDIKIQRGGDTLDKPHLIVQFEQDRVIRAIPFYNLSDGEKCFIISAMVIAMNREYGPFLCFWDEPDNYVALHEIGYFVMALRRSFKVQGQLIVTSHNPEVFRKFPLERTFLLSRKSRSEPPTVRELSDDDLTESLEDAILTHQLEYSA